jgi:alpha/beta superfamily hydrolase
VLGFFDAADAHADAIDRAADGTYLVLAAERGTLRLYLGTASADTRGVTLDSGTTLVGPTGVLDADPADARAVMLVTPSNELLVGWSSGGRARVAVCPLVGNDGPKRALRKTSYRPTVDLGPGRPTAIAWNGAHGMPLIAGAAEENGGLLWVSRLEKNGRWTREKLAGGQGDACAQLAVSRLGIAHLVWRDAAGAVWHLESAGPGQWLRSGGTSVRPERIGTAAGTPAIACVDHQVLVVLPTTDAQLEYSLYTGQNWNANLPLTRLDKRWAKDRLSQPRITVDGRGVPWLLFASTTGPRKYAYATRWLGFGWDTIREARGIFHATSDFLDNLAPIEDMALPGWIAPGADEFGLLLVNRSVPRPLRVHRLQTPAPAGRAGTEILLLDMLDVGQSLWTEQVLQTAKKHAGNPIFRPSGDPHAIDSHRVFNGGMVLRDEGLFKTWYCAVNPEGDWSRWWDLLHFCYATSRDGITWDKPRLDLVEFQGRKANNAIPGLNIFMPVLLNPDAKDRERKFLGYHPGRGALWSSADGVHWRQEPIRCTLLGPKPKWFVLGSVLYDPTAPAARRWRAYGCMCPNEPPVRRTIAYAYSADGRNFFGHAENPIFQAETSSSWHKVHDVAVCRYKNHYLMLYQTGNGYDQHLELAASRDGEHFVRIGDGQPVVAQGAGNAWDRGLHLPSVPLVLDDEIRLYYGAADYQAPGDSPFQYERWKKCRMGMGLATLPLDGWTYVRNTAGHHIGYLTTVPIRVEDLRGCVLTVNAQADKDNYLLAELLDGQTGARVAGYEQENGDPMNRSGVAQVMSWHGRAGLDHATGSVRVRIIFRGRGDALRLYSLAFRKQAGAEPPTSFSPRPGLVEKPLVYRSSVSHLDPLKAWMAYRPDGRRKPVVVAMHGYGDPVLRHGGRRMLGTTRSYAERGLFALAVDLRGREESAGQRDDGGLEVMDIYDAVQAAVAQYPGEADPTCVNLIGWSGGGGNTFSAVTRTPDLFSNAAAFFGITDYGYWADTSFKGLIQPNVGGETRQVPDRYLARNSLLGVGNNAYTRFQFFWDEKERICPSWMDTEYRRIASELGYRNITPHESLATDRFRWLHEGMDRASAAESERLTLPFMLHRNNPSPTIKPEGRLMVLGYLMTRRFQVLAGHGNDAVAELRYRLAPHQYRFQFSRKSSDPEARAWLRLTDRAAGRVVGVTQDGRPLAWEALPNGQTVIRDITLTGTVVVQFK